MNNNRAITAEKDGRKTVIVVNYKSVKDFVKVLEESGCTCKVYDVNFDNVPLEYFPEEIQNEVRRTLKSFDSCHIENCNGKMSVRTGWCVSASYAYDECVLGEYKAKEVYTKEELRQAHKEVFGYAF